jgi:hypothetical protein
MGMFDIYMATRAEPNAPFDEAVALDEFNTESYDVMPNLSPDGLKVYFTRTNDAFGPSTWSEILLATRNSREEPFTPPRVLEELRVPGRLVFGCRRDRG